MKKVLKGIMCFMLSIIMISPLFSPALINAEEEEIVEEQDEVEEEIVEKTEEEIEEIETENESVIASGKCGVSVYWQINDDGKLLITGNAEMYNYSPGEAPWYPYKNYIERIDVDYGVTTIGASAFYGIEDVNSIHISNTVTTIGKKAFSHCDFEGITIPSSVKTIKSEAFSYSRIGGVSLTGTQITEIQDSTFEGCNDNGYCFYVDLPEGLKKIGNKAFYNSAISDLTIPDSVTFIENNAFEGCTKLRGITLKQGTYADSYFGSSFEKKYIETISSGECGDNAKWTLSDSGTLTISGSGEVSFESIYGKVDEQKVKKIIIGANINNIDVWYFSYFENVESISVDANNSVYDSRDNCNAIIKTSTDTLVRGCKNTIIPDSVITIGYKAFQNCSMSRITIPEGVIKIESRAFNGCVNIKGITIPSSVKVIEEGAFSSCSSINRITLSEGLQSIGNDAFSLSNIKTLEIPTTVTEIGSGILFGCSNLESLTFQGNAPVIDGSLFTNFFHYFDDYKEIKIYYPSNDSSWTQSVRENCIPETVDVTWIPSKIYQSELAGYKMNLQKNEVIMNYCYSLSSSVVNNGSKIYLQLTRPNGTVKNVYVNKATKKVIDGKTYYLFPCDVSAKDMTGIIKAQMVFPDGRATAEDLYSVEECATKIINGSAFTEKEQKIAKAMLTYGKYVQQYFNYNMSRLPKNVNTLGNINFTDSSYNYKNNLVKNNDDVVYVGSRLELTSSMKLKLYFKDTASKSYFFNGSTPITSATTGMTLSTEGSYKIITISNITDLTKLYTIRYGTSGTYSSSKNSVLKYSVYNYGYEANRQNKTSLVNLLKAMDSYYKVFG